MNTDISTARLRQAIAIRERIESLQSELAGIFGGGGGRGRRGRRRGRRPRRVAAVRAAKPRRKKRKLSPEARARISAAVKARWARARAGKSK
jgi:hypothetical protein